MAGRSVLVCMALALLGALLVPSAALPGLGGATITSRGVLEAELYDVAPSAGCNPTGDGEWVQPRSSPLRSSGGYAFIPETRCYIEFTALAFPTGGQFSRMFVEATGSTATLTYTTQFLIDGSLVQSVTYTIVGGSGYQDIAIPSGTATTAGVHTLRIVHIVTSGAYWHNLNIDCIKFAETDPYPCPAPKADFAWAPACHNEGMVFTDLSTPGALTSLATARWDFGDGTTLGPIPWRDTVVHVYGAPGTYTVTLTVTDDNGLADTHQEDVQVCNTPPVLAVADAYACIGNSVAVTVGGADPNGDPVTASVTSGLPPGLVLDGARIVGRPPATPSQFGVDVSLTDGYATVTDQLTIHVVHCTPFSYSPPDTDQDGLHDLADNCPLVWNQDQADADGDGVGNVCITPAAGGGVEPAATGEALAAPVVDGAEPAPGAAPACRAHPVATGARAERDGDHVRLTWEAGPACGHAFHIWRDGQLVDTVPAWEAGGAYTLFVDAPAEAHAYRIVAGPASLGPLLDPLDPVTETVPAQTTLPAPAPAFEEEPLAALHPVARADVPWGLVSGLAASVVVLVALVAAHSRLRMKPVTPQTGHSVARGASPSVTKSAPQLGHRT